MPIAANRKPDTLSPWNTSLVWSHTPGLFAPRRLGPKPASQISCFFGGPPICLFSTHWFPLAFDCTHLPVPTFHSSLRAGARERRVDVRVHIGSLEAKLAPPRQRDGEKCLYLVPRRNGEVGRWLVKGWLFAWLFSLSITSHTLSGIQNIRLKRAGAVMQL